MATKRQRREKTKKLKGLGLVILSGFIWLITVVFVIADRLLCSFWVTKDLPGIGEIYEFKHEREAIAKRFSLYFVMVFLYFVYWIIYKLIF